MNFQKNSVFNLLSILVSVSLVLAIFIGTYVFLWPVDVIKDSTWKLTVDNQIYHPGSEITVHAVADKLRPLQGTFIRTVECKATGNFVSYHIADSLTNRQAGHVVTDIPTKLPLIIPAPSTCRMAFVIEYKVYSFRSFSEYNTTNEFQVIP